MELSAYSHRFYNTKSSDLRTHQFNTDVGLSSSGYCELLAGSVESEGLKRSKSPFSFELTILRGLW
jgi:hypothetical protein